MKTLNLNAKIKENILKTLKKYPEITRAIIFGSRVKKQNQKNSDIDLAIYCQDKFPIGLRLDLDEQVGLYKIDILNMNLLSNEKLRTAIEKEGIEIFTKNRKMNLSK